MICRRVFYKGNVQGVGFRYTTVRVAEGFQVKGFVRNLSDGRVELCVEGKPAEVDAFLEQLAEAMGGHIRDIQARDEPLQHFDSFGIRY